MRITVNKIWTIWVVLCVKEFPDCTELQQESWDWNEPLGEEQRGQTCWEQGSLSQHVQPGGACEQGFLQKTGTGVSQSDCYQAFQTRHLLEGKHSNDQAIQELLLQHKW